MMWRLQIPLSKWRTNVLLINNLRFCLQSVVVVVTFWSSGCLMAIPLSSSSLRADGPKSTMSTRQCTASSQMFHLFSLLRMLRDDTEENEIEEEGNNLDILPRRRSSLPSRCEEQKPPHINLGYIFRLPERILRGCRTADKDTQTTQTHLLEDRFKEFF